MYGMRKDKLHLLPHDPAWSTDFAAEQRRIRCALSDSAAVIEHVGSTAIPTVHAKPILDIAILCGKKGVRATIQALAGLGYEYRGQYGDQLCHHYAVLDRGNIRYCQAHVYSEATADWRSKLMFRDVLRENVELACEYEACKRRLAEIAFSKTDYAQMKSAWVDSFIIKLRSASPKP